MERKDGSMLLEASDGSGIMLLPSPGLVACRRPGGARTVGIDDAVPDGTTIEDLTNDFVPIVDEATVSVA